MTICIAAMCDGGKAVVVASDRMITAGFLALEFEHPDAKIDELASTCVGLATGDALANIELFRACRARIQELQAPSVELIANRVKDQFVLLRQRKAEDEVLAPRGLTLKAFYTEGLITRLPPELAMMIDSQVQQARYPVGLIIAGTDQTGAHIYGVEDPGVVACYDRLGYHSIGSGESHALLTIIAGQHSQTRDVNQTVYLVYEAKRRAEVAQGVGEATDLAIVSPGRIRPVSEDEKVILQQIYVQRGVPQLAHVQEAVSQLPFAKGD